MRTLSLLPLAFAVVQAGAFAAPQVDQTEPSLSEIQVRSVMPGYRLQPDEIAQVNGTYRLDNGTALKISNVRRTLYAQIGERTMTELVPVAADRFVSPDQRITMQYRPAAFGDELVMTYPSDMNVASSPLVTVRLALNQ